jgi:enoyl-CoA hydratase/3-hydroxyacyl-CoA dehydrogenase
VRELVDGDVVARAVELARQLATGKAPRSRMSTTPLTGVPNALPPIDIGHLSKRVDAILCKALLEGARLPLPEGLLLEAKCFGEVCGTKDMKIGVANFLQHGPRSKAPFVHA